MPTPYTVIVAGLLASMPAVHAQEQDIAAHAMQGDLTPWHVGGISNGRLPFQSWGNYEFFDGFFAMRSVKSTYIGLFCLCLFGKSARTTRETAANQSAGTAGTTTGTTAAGTTNAAATTRAEKLIRDLILLLLVPLVVNGFGRGSGVGVEILTWIFFALATIFAMVEFIAGNRLFRSGFNFLLIALSLVIFILAFAAGWHIP
ncbi:hypothetical protein BDF22DRAFT_661861 [Syncephalis plumigaleata]|nr:hypothetical protein BDF22DRAFT_661861 [Syncephalis plumigaleata]